MEFFCGPQHRRLLETEGGGKADKTLSTAAEEERRRGGK